METNKIVEKADVMSRKRAVLLLAAGVVFLGVQLIIRPIHSGPAGESPQHLLNGWAINAIALMLLLVIRLQGGLLNRKEIRELINDDVPREHHREAVIDGFWVAMIGAMAIFFLPAFRSYTAQEGSYLIVTAAVGFSVLRFSYLEFRAHHDA